MSTNLQTYLADRDEPCPNCRYNLRSLTGNVCPECQQELSLRIGMLDPVWKSLIATIMGLTIGAGVPICVALFCSGLIILKLERLSEGERKQFIIVPSAVAMFFLVALIALLRSSGRQWFRARSALIRTVLAIVTWMLSLAAIVGWSAWVINY